MQPTLVFDWETHLIGGNERVVCQCGEVHSQFPPAVCLSWAREDGSSGVVLKDEGLDILEAALDDEDCHIVGHEIAFDVFVSIENSENPAAWVDAWVKAYDQGRVHDTGIRQKLIDLAWGRYRWHRHANGHATHIGYDLATTSKRNGGPRLNKADEWRMKYATLDGIPIARWPSEAVQYSLLDVIGTGWSYENQSEWRTNTDILKRWAGFLSLPDGFEPDALADEQAQTCHALWLKAMTGHGIRTDLAAIRKYEARARREYDELAIECFSYGLIRREYWRDLQRMRAEGHPMKGNKPWADLKIGMDLDLPAALSAWEELSEEKLVRMRYVKNAKVAQGRMLDVCEAKGLEIPRTDGWKKALDAGREPAYEEYVAIDSEACRLSEDDQLTAYAELTHYGKILTADVKQLLLGVDAPIHSHFEPLLETGRISSSDPNLTNRARGEEDHAGDRECFVPREAESVAPVLAAITAKAPDGFVLLDYDFPQLELFAFSQCCKWLLGYSSMGDALNTKLPDGSYLDAHLDFAADIEGLSYEEAARRIELGKEDPKRRAIKKARDAAKGYNFGRWGGLGTETFTKVSPKAYGVTKTQDQWDEIFALGDAKWIEAKDYFNFIQSLESEVVVIKGKRVSYFNVPQVWSGRLRARATYCSACNSFYQGLGADVAKLAGWYLFKACYVRGVDPVLYGCRIVNFIHDQFLIECPESRAAAACKRVEYWCGLASINVLPDYGQAMADKGECIIARRWSKQSKAVRNDNGDLIAWDDERLVG